MDLREAMDLLKSVLHEEVDGVRTPRARALEVVLTGMADRAGMVDDALAFVETAARGGASVVRIVALREVLEGGPLPVTARG